MDRMIYCGKTQPFTLSISSLDTHWPVAEDDFAFGEGGNRVHAREDGNGLLDCMDRDMKNYYSILTRGFDIWARILVWVVSGGRRIPGMCLPENHPWVAGSVWRLLYDDLQEWRNRQDKRLHFPITSVESHAALGQAEPFVYLNLIYYAGWVMSPTITGHAQAN
jgi:hypothetical protein